MNLLKTASFNVEIAKRFGLFSAALISYISGEYALATKNEWLNKNGTFSIRRSDIYEAIGMTNDEQMAVEASLGKAGILEVLPFKDEVDRVYYRFNESVVYKVLGQVPVQSAPTMIANSIDSQTVKSKRITAAEKSMNEAKRAIKEEDESLRQMWCDWIDAVYARHFTLTVAAVTINEKQLSTYDRAKKEEILQNAIKNGYRDISWSIKACNNSGDTIPKNWKSYESMQPNSNTEISKESF